MLCLPDAEYAIQIGLWRAGEAEREAAKVVAGCAQCAAGGPVPHSTVHEGHCTCDGCF